MFVFLKYLKPVHWFILPKKDGTTVFPVLQPSDLTQIPSDEHYRSELACSYDRSWQAVQKGAFTSGEYYTTFDPVPVEDEYRFVRKYFNRIWALYILVLRILSFKAPWIEFSAYWKTRGQRRYPVFKESIGPETVEIKGDGLLDEAPLVTVIIPTLNRYQYLRDVLLDLSKQTYKNFEVIVVDQSAPYKPEFYQEFDLDLKLIRQEEPLLWTARNTAIKQGKGSYYLLFDDDSRVDPDWIAAHLKGMDHYDADISSGTSISVQGAKVPENYRFYRLADQLDTGNVLIKRTVFEQIGLFDRQFEKQRMGDGEYGLRAYLHGFRNISNPEAERLHLKVGKGGLRQMGSWDAYRPKKMFGPRPIPSVVYLYRNYFGAKHTRLALLKNVPPSIMPYQYKKSKLMMLIGGIVSLLLLPLVLLQVWVSWSEATRKLKEGAKIDPYA